AIVATERRRACEHPSSIDAVRAAGLAPRTALVEPAREHEPDRDPDRARRDVRERIERDHVRDAVGADQVGRALVADAQVEPVHQRHEDQRLICDRQHERREDADPPATSPAEQAEHAEAGAAPDDAVDRERRDRERDEVGGHQNGSAWSSLAYGAHSTGVSSTAKPTARAAASAVHATWSPILGLTLKIALS